jgi:hypothetical protein
MLLMIQTFLMMAAQSEGGTSQQELIVTSYRLPQPEKFPSESTAVTFTCPVPFPAG